MQPPTPPEMLARLMAPEHRVSRSYLLEVQEAAFDDPATQPYLYRKPGERTGDGEWKKEHVLIVPLETRDHGLIGIISVDEPVEGKIPSLETIQGLEIFANLAAVAIDNARLLEEASEAEALRHLDRLKSEFLASVSHDLRTPLTVIKGSIDLLGHNKSGLSETQAKLVDGIGRNTSGLLEMVEQLLDMIQLQDGRIHLNKQRTDINELSRDVVESMEIASAQRGQAVALHHPGRNAWWSDLGGQRAGRRNDIYVHASNPRVKPP